VAKLAFPLATLREARDELQEQLVEHPGVKRSALMPALPHIDGLLQGTKHPLWRCTDAVRRSTPNRRPPGEVEMLAVPCRLAFSGPSWEPLGPRSESRGGIMVQTECLKRPEQRVIHRWR
jgi:hypothetical protein